MGEPDLSRSPAPGPTAEPAVGSIAPAEPALERRVLTSTLAGYGIQVVRLLLGFFSKLWLARLVLPEPTGLFEESLRIVTILAAVRDLGLPYQLMRDRERPYGTVFWFTALSGAVLAGGLIAAAPLFGALQPGLPPLLRVMALWLVLDAFSVVPRVYFERELRIGRLVGPEVARIAVAAVVAVGLALRGGGVWSFVWAELVAAAVAALWAWRATGGAIPLRPQLELLPALLRRSSGLFVIWIVVQLVTYIDVFVIEWFGATASVGAYARSYWIVFLVAALAWPRPLLPALVASRDDRDRLFQTLRLGAVQVFGCQVLASYFVFVNAPTVVALVLGAEWAAAAPLVRALAFIPLVYQFSQLGGELLKVRHEDRVWLAVMVLNLASLVGFGAWLTAGRGAAGMATANYLLLGNALMAYQLYRIFGARLGRLFLDFALLCVVPLPLFAATCFLPVGGGRFAAGLAAGLVAAAILVRIYGADFRRFFALGR
jgi:PST family polysaccharide transporter